MASALIVVPVIDVFVARACLRHLRPSQRDVLVVNNTGDSAFGEELLSQGWVIVGRRNIGVAAAWNLGRRQVLTAELDYLIITSSAMIYLQGMVDLIEKLPTDPAFPTTTGFGWHCKPIPRQQLLDVGEFDEQFFPAYYEDADFERRSMLAGWNGGIPFPVSAIDLGSGHGAMRVSINYEELARKWEQKWGGPHGAELFSTPYNK